MCKPAENNLDIPDCSCPDGLLGNPWRACRKPGSCTTDADCRRAASCNGTMCNCIHGFKGSPWLEKGSCQRNCSHQTCEDPCEGLGAVKAICGITKHSAICTCPPRHRGDPYRKCTLVANSKFTCL